MVHIKAGMRAYERFLKSDRNAIIAYLMSQLGTTELTIKRHALDKVAGMTLELDSLLNKGLRIKLRPTTPEEQAQHDDPEL